MIILAAKKEKMKRKIKKTVIKPRGRRTVRAPAKLIVRKSLSRNPRKKLAKRKIRQARPVHKRILLHPLSILVILCAGVFIAGWTFRTIADSYTVTASVLAPVPPNPATITYPVDQTHFTSTPVAISGVCSPNTYVELYVNGNFSGMSNCGASVTSYQISADLSPGTNTLYTRIFSVTNNEGPESAQITVFYDLPPTPPPPVPNSPPASLEVISQDGTSYRAGSVAVVSSYPTITGLAPPGSKVTVVFHSATLTCITYADSSGVWSCQLDQPLGDGLHQVDISVVTPSGTVLYFPAYYIRVSSNVAPLHHIGGPLRLFLINSNYQYQVYSYGQTTSLSLSLTGGVSPYAFTISWGDGSQSTIARGNQSAFVATHTYTPSGSGLRDYTIEIQAVDKNGATTFLQMSVVVRGQLIAGTALGQCAKSSPGSSYSAAAQANTSLCGSSSSSLLSWFKQWLWLVWPTYAVVVLMVFSFWLGERQELLVILNKKRAKRRYRRA